MAYYDFLNVVFAPLFRLPTVLAIMLLSFIISLIIILVTKYTTDQALMKRLKEEIKEHQNQIKQLRSEPAKAMEVQKKAMEYNMKYMMHSFKPTLITFLPIILIFGWMNSVFAYESIKPGQEFSITALFDKNANGSAELIVPEGINLVSNKTQKIENAKASWSLKGKEGEYLLELVYNGDKQEKNILITNTKRYIEPIKKTEGAIKSIQIGYKKLIVLSVGFKDWMGWLGTYILSSITFTVILRKIIKVY